MKVIEFPKTGADLPSFLRSLADSIESGEFDRPSKLFGIMECEVEGDESYYVTFCDGAPTFTKLETYGLIQLAGHVLYNAQYGGSSE